MQADTFIYIDSGTYNIATTASWITASSNDSCYSKSGSTYTKVASDQVGSNFARYYQMVDSVKGIKVGEIDYEYTDANGNVATGEVSSDKYIITIKGGTFLINSTDDAIHSNSGDVVISGGNLAISTLDDGVHADDDLTISAGTINISKSYEAFEGKTVTISGGTIVAYAQDDGINAAKSELTTAQQKASCYIKISGGKVYINADGDGIDSNGQVQITGGETYVYGSGNGGNGALDSESGIIINGGILVAVSYYDQGQFETPSSSSSQKIVVSQVSSSKGDVSLKDSSGNVLATFAINAWWTANKNYTGVIVSTPELVSGTSYILTSGTSNYSVIAGTSNNSSGTNGQMPSFGPGGPRR